MINGISEITNSEQPLYTKKTPQVIKEEQSHINEIEDSFVPSDNKDIDKLCGYIYYQGERISQADFVRQAIESGVIKMDETKSAYQAYDEAWELLVEAKAKPLFSWSKSLYSEDGMYKFRVEDGEITGMVLARDSQGNTFQEIANDLASGIRPCDMKSDYSWLCFNDPELYDAAMKIGQSKRLYDRTSKSYNNGAISYEQYLKDLQPLFFILFGSSDTNKLSDLKTFYSQDSDDFVKQAFESYNPKRYYDAFASIK